MAETKLETWRNNGNGRVGLTRTDSTGAVHRDLHGGKKVFHITTEDRKLNGLECASDALNPFLNGTLTPCTVIEDAEDLEKLASNPNVLADADITELFEVHWKTFEKRLEDIDLPVTLQRIVDVGEQSDAPAKRVAAAKERLASLRPAQAVESVTVAAGPGMPEPEEASYYDLAPKN